jgi:hypothetical protein
MGGRHRTLKELAEEFGVQAEYRSLLKEAELGRQYRKELESDVVRICRILDLGADYDVLKGLLSHSTMLIGCLYMCTGRFIRIRVFNTLSVAVGLAIFILCGLCVNGLYEACGLEAPDGMWLKSSPYIGISPMILGIVAVVILFCVLALWELRLPVEKRWYYNLHRRKKK